MTDPLPDEVKWRLEKAEGFMDLQMAERARSELNLVPEAHQQSLAWRLLRLRLAFDQHDWTLATELAKRMREEQPAVVDYWIQLAYATRRCLGVDAAKVILEEAAMRFPEIALIPFNLACYECRLGQNDAALRHLNRAFEMEPSYREMALEDEDLKPLWSTLG